MTPATMPELEQLLLARTSMSAPDGEAAEPPAKVLLVADNKKELYALQLLLGADDYQVLTAVSAAECFELLALVRGGSHRV